MARVELASKIIHLKYTTSLFRLIFRTRRVDRKVKGEQNLSNLFPALILLRAAKKSAKS